MKIARSLRPVLTPLARYARRRPLKLLLLVVLAGGLWFVIHYLRTPAEGHLINAQQSDIPHPTARAKSPKLPATTVDNTYFQLALPVGYRPQAPVTVAGLLFSQTLIKPSATGSLVIAISLKNLPAGGLASDPSYHLRQQQDSRYSFSSQTISGEDVQIVNDSQEAVVVAFWPHGGYLATISVSSGIGNPGDGENRDNIRALQPLLQAWQWR